MGKLCGIISSLGRGLASFVLLILTVSLSSVCGATSPGKLDPTLYKEYLDLLQRRSEGHFDEIFDGMQQLIQRDPTFWRAYQKVVEAAKELNDASGALDYFQGLLDENPQNPYAYYGLGLVHRSLLKDNAAWFDTFQRAIALDPTFALIYETYSTALGNGVSDFPHRVTAELDLNGGNGAAHYGLGLAHERHHKSKEALESFAKAIELSPDLIQAYIAASDLYASKGNYQELLQTSRRGLELADRLDDWEYREYFLGNLSKAYYGLSDYVHSLEYSHRALDLARKLGDANAEQRRLGGIGINYMELNNYSSALEFLEQALKISRQLKSKGSEDIHLGNIGRLYTRLGQYPQALKYLNEAAAIAKKIGYLRGLGFNLTNIGFTYISSGEPNKAVQSLLQAERIVEDKHLLGYINVYLGAAEFKRGNSRSMDYLQRALQIAEEIGDKKLEALALNYLGGTQLKNGQPSKAAQSHSRALSIGEQKDIAWVIWDAHAGLGAVYEKQGDFQKAEDAYKRAVDAIENVRAGNANLDDGQKISFLSSKMEVYEHLNTLLARLHRLYPSQGYDKLAFHYSERAKARSMLDILQRDKADLKETPVDVAAAQAQLDGKTVLLEYFVGKHQSLLFVVTNKDFRMFPLQGRAIGEIADKFVAGAKEPANHSAYLSYVVSGHKLYNLLVKPAEGLLKGKNHLVIVADGRLHYVPFAALLDRTVELQGDVNFSKLPYLIKKYSIRYAHSASVLKALNEARPTQAASRGFLGISANPKGNYFAKNGYLKGGTLYTSMEVNAIARMYMSKAVVAAPTRENVKAVLGTADYKGIHFAVCGMFDGSHPRLDLNCGEDAKQSRYLNLSDILGLDLKTELVVLSACQTGLGHDAKGEGVLGFSRAFIYAGASAVMVTLWRISDQSSPEFMGRFHKYWKSHNKADAVRLAALDLIQSKYAHPFHWASFVLVGAEQRPDVVAYSKN